MKKRRFSAVIIPFFLCGSAVMADTQWTSLHHKIFSAQEIEQANTQKVVTFVKDAVMPFSQLMFSWNALRPVKGYFSFWVQVREHTTQHWGSWYKMMEWGHHVQRSYTAGSARDIQYCHVRLEMGCKKADAFRIKIVAHEGARLGLLRAIFIALSDFGNFQSEVESRAWEQLPSLLLPDIPKKSQFMLDHPRNNGMCSPTSCTMLASYLMGHDIDPLHFAQHAFDTGLDAYGSWPFNMAHAFVCCHGNYFFAVARLPSFNALYQRLNKGFPVVVSVRGFLEGAPKVYEKGHLLMVVGWDAATQSVLCHDPALHHDDAVFRSYPIKSFLHAWERSHRLAYLAEKAQ